MPWHNIPSHESTLFDCFMFQNIEKDKQEEFFSILFIYNKISTLAISFLFYTNSTEQII